MKNLLILTALISCFALFAFKPKHHVFASFDHSVLDSFPNTARTSNDSTRNLIRGMVVGGQGSQFTPYADTLTANNSPIHTYPGAAISVKGELYVRDSTATKWVKVNASGGSTISIYQDSILVICNLNGCDSFQTHIIINNVTILNDTTIQVCPASGSCDTIIINPTPFSKPYTDSVKVQNTTNTNCIDTISYYINGNRFIGGYVNHCTLDTIYTQLPLYVYTDSLGHRIIAIRQQDGLISGGIVTWSGTGLIFDITAATYVINGNYYTSPARSDTLSPADTAYSRIDLFIVDTLGEATHLTGTPAPSPTAPQPDPNSQLALTTGLTINVGDTIPNNVQLETIFDENAGTPTEWAYTTSGTITANANNTDNPKHLTKAIYVSSYNNNSKLNFTSASLDTINNGEILKGWIYFNGAFTNKFRFQLYNGLTAVTNGLVIYNTFGINPNDSNHYQQFAIPLSAFVFTTTPYFNKLVITHIGTDNSGAKGYYIDYIQLQNGVIPVTPPTDYSNKVDSTGMLTVNDSTYVPYDVIKGVRYYRNDTIKIHSTGGGGTGNTNSNVGTGYRLAIPGTNDIKTLLCSGCALDSVTTNVITLTVTPIDTTGKFVNDVVGLTDSTIAVYKGSGSSVITIRGIGGSQTTYDSLAVATAGQAAFTFPSVPATKSDYEISVWGVIVDPALYTVSGNIVTFLTGLSAGDKVLYHRIK